MTKKELSDAHTKTNELFKQAKNKYQGAIILGVTDNGQLDITSTTNNFVEILGILTLAQFEINVGILSQKKEKENES